MKNKAVIYGAGYYGPKVFNVMRRYFDIVAFADQDPVKQGTLFCGLPVLSSDAKELCDIQIIMGCQDEKAEEWCKSLTPAVIPFSLSQLLIWQQEEEEASHFELSEDELSETRLLPDRIELLRRIQNSLSES